MDDIIENKKKELVSYITMLEDESQINDLYDYVQDSELNEEAFDFEKEWEKGFSRKESQNRVIEQLENRWNK